MASSEFATFRELVEATRDPTGEADIEAMRRSIERGGGRFPARTASSPTSIGGVPGEWVTTVDARDAANDPASPAMLYLHGGGYVSGSPSSHRNITGTLATLVGCAVFVADYRLAPEDPHPAAVTDAVAVYRALLDAGRRPEQLVIAGDSAGGGLAMALLLAARDAGLPLPAGAVLISPWVDMEGTGNSITTRADVDPMIQPGMLRQIAAAFLGPDGNPTDPLASPLLAADLGGLPPTLIHVGDAEVLLDDATRLADRLTAAGSPVELAVYPEMIHVWHGAAGFVPEADHAMAAISTFVRPLLVLS
ncbi:MAG: alpha/beta hydrolase [Actinomycetota bacterium]